MKKENGVVLLIFILILVQPFPSHANVVWGDLNNQYLFQWHIEKQTLEHYQHGIFTRSADELILSLHGLDNGKAMPSNFDVLAGNKSIYYKLVDGEYSFQPVSSEYHLLLLPVQVNGSNYFEFLFTEKSSLENLTSSVITETSISNGKATMAGICTEGGNMYDVFYTWDTSSGLLLEKRVEGENGKIFVIQLGEKPVTFNYLNLLYLIPLGATILFLLGYFIWTFVKMEVTYSFSFRKQSKVIVGFIFTLFLGLVWWILYLASYSNFSLI